jgi:tetratricopeptide (TPR) repeat protein
MTDFEKAKQALINAHNAGDVESAKKIANFIKSSQLSNAVDGVKDDSISARIKQDISSTVTKLKENKEKYKSGEQGALQTLSHTLGTSLGGYGAVLSEPIVSAYKMLPEVVKSGVSGESGVNKQLAEIGGLIQKVGEYVPEKAKPYVSDAINIASTLPIGKVTSMGASLAGRGAKTGAEKLAEVGKLAENSAEASRMAEIQRSIMPKLSKEQYIARAQKPNSMSTEGLIFKEKVFNPTTIEKRAAEEASKIKGFKTGNRFTNVFTPRVQENVNLVNKTISEEADSLIKKLESENISMLDRFGKNEFLSVLDQSAKNILEKSSIVASPSAQKQFERFVDQFKRLVSQNDQTAAGLLTARKQFDKFIDYDRPKTFNQDYEDALSLATRAIRQDANKLVIAKAPYTKTSLDKQSALYKAKENLSRKAYEEAHTTAGRAMNLAGDIGTAKGAALAALTAGGLAVNPATVAIPAALYTAGKAATSQTAKKALGKTLQLPNNILNKILGMPAKQAEETFQAIKSGKLDPDTLLLSPPEKMSGIPMTDEQIRLAKSQIERTGRKTGMPKENTVMPDQSGLSVKRQQMGDYMSNEGFKNLTWTKQRQIEKMLPDYTNGLQTKAQVARKMMKLGLSAEDTKSILDSLYQSKIWRKK